MKWGNTGQERARMLVIMTAQFPPLRWLYRQLYYLAARFTAWRISRITGVRSVYLRRGCAVGEIHPGVSDVDIGVIADFESRLAIEREYARCVAFLPMLERTCEMFWEDQYLTSYLWRPQIHLRMDEGKRVWRRYFGADSLALLPPPDPVILRWGMYIEAFVWWGFFSQRALLPEGSLWESVEGRSLAYKVLAETARLYCGLKTGTLESIRKRGLMAGKSWFGAEGEALSERALLSERSGFLRKDPTLVSDTYQFLLKFIPQWHKDAMALPDLKATLPNAIRVDVAWEEWGISASEEATLRDIGNWASEWQGFLGASVACCACYGIEDIVLSVWLKEGSAPSRDQVGRWTDRARARLAGSQRRVFLFLQLGDIALQVNMIGIKELRGVHAHFRALLSPTIAPETFETLSRAEFCLVGKPPPKPPRLAWTRFQDFYMARWELMVNFAGAAFLLRNSVVALSDRLFLTYWWKALQMIVIRQSAMGNGEILFPMTCAAIRRGLAALGEALPASFLAFETEFHRAVLGEEVHLGAQKEEGQRYLKQVYARFSPGISAS